MRYMLIAALLSTTLLGACTSSQHTQRAPHRALHLYHRAERHNERSRARLRPALIFWN